MNRIITISREYGAGGHSIGRRLADTLGIPFYDRDIILETARASGYDVSLIEQEEEDVSRAGSIMESICAVSSTYYQDTHQAIHDIQRAVILHYAQEGPCVILGRCADVFLQEAGIPCINVFICADEAHRIARIQELTGVTNAAELQKMLARKDASRHNYYRLYTDRKWGDSRNYHMTLDSGALGYDLCVKLITQAAQAAE